MPELNPSPLLDQLQLWELREDPDRWEALVLEEQERAADDPQARAILESVYWEADRETAFRRYLASRDFATTLQLLRGWQVRSEQSLVEVGAGSGFLAWALTQSGFSDVSILEPNPHFVTGTGYLRTRSDARELKIVNSLDAWYGDHQRYHHVVTRNCVHHFPNLAWVAACLRSKLHPGGNWFMIREPLVESARDWYAFLQGHPYSQNYRVFEYAGPASQYIQAVELAGFRLRGVVPAGFANNCLSLLSESPGSRINQAWTASVAAMQRRVPAASVLAYRLEQLWPRRLRLRGGCFTRPQVLWFQRQELGELPPGTIWYPRHKTPA